MQLRFGNRIANIEAALCQRFQQMGQDRLTGAEVGIVRRNR